MQITIVTVFNSHNYGSFLQAKQLAIALEKYGDVSFLDSQTRNNFKVFINKVKRTIKRSEKISDIIQGPVFEFKEWIQIRRCWRSLKRRTDIAGTDIAILGSDEIWNISREECRYPLYWGAGIETKKISYAPSINKAIESDFTEHPEYIRYLQEIQAVSVRDIHSKMVVEKFLGRKVEVVLDPTLLFEPEKADFFYHKPYIAVYLFEGSLSEDERKSIVLFAKDKKMPLVSAGQYLSWCDDCVHSQNGNPFFVFENAEYVITNTFHGTAYAINYKTQFVALGAKKPKIKSMLCQFGLERRIAGDPQEISQVLASKIDYFDVNRIVCQLRRSSLEYLTSSIRN